MGCMTSKAPKQQGKQPQPKQIISQQKTDQQQTKSRPSILEDNNQNQKSTSPQKNNQNVQASNQQNVEQISENVDWPQDDDNRKNANVNIKNNNNRQGTPQAQQHVDQENWPSSGHNSNQQSVVQQSMKPPIVPKKNVQKHQELDNDEPVPSPSVVQTKSMKNSQSTSQINSFQGGSINSQQLNKGQQKSLKGSESVQQLHNNPSADMGVASFQTSMNVIKYDDNKTQLPDVLSWQGSNMITNNGGSLYNKKQDMFPMGSVQQQNENNERVDIDELNALLNLVEPMKQYTVLPSQPNRIQLNSISSRLQQNDEDNNNITGNDIDNNKSSFQGAFF